MRPGRRAEPASGRRRDPACRRARSGRRPGREDRRTAGPGNGDGFRVGAPRAGGHLDAHTVRRALPSPVRRAARVGCARAALRGGSRRTAQSARRGGRRQPQRVSRRRRRCRGVGGVGGPAGSPSRVRRCPRGGSDRNERRLRGGRSCGGRAGGVAGSQAPQSRRAPGDPRGPHGHVHPYNPEAPFSVGNAMGRNRLIYALSALTLVVASEVDKGAPGRARSKR